MAQEEPRLYYCRGYYAATAASTFRAVAALWNPHATKRIRVVEVYLTQGVGVSATQMVWLFRISARGTAGSTVTPDADNDTLGEVAPVSGALLDLSSYTVQPTRLTVACCGFSAMPNSGVPVFWPLWPGLVVPPGAGLAIISGAASVSIPAGEVNYVWEE